MSRIAAVNPSTAADEIKMHLGALTSAFAITLI